MLNQGKLSVLGVKISAVDYEAAVQAVIRAAERREPFAVAALAVHGVMTGVFDAEHRYRLNQLDLVTPDGQPVRWALNLLYGVGLAQRVYGPDLTLKVCAEAAARGLGLYLYGSTPDVLSRLQANLSRLFPDLCIAGAEPSRFRKLTAQEKVEVVERIQRSGARLVLVGLGCPRQEVWAYEYRHELHMPLLAIGAAFDFHAGNKAQAPRWMQDRGLEWLFRLSKEPRRLWKRYLILNPAYLVLLAAQKFGLRRFDSPGTPPRTELSYG